MILLYLLIIITIFIFGQFCDQYKYVSLFWNIYGALVILMNISLIFFFDKWYNAIRKAWIELQIIMRD